MRCSPFLILPAVALVFALSSSALAEKIFTVTSEPSDARVEVNGKLVGNTPIQAKMKEFYFKGPKYLWSEFLQTPLTMTVSKEGYIPQTITITSGPYTWVNANYTATKIYYVITQTSFHVNLQRIGGYPGANPLANNSTTVAITSEPTGAEITVDGQFVSSTPSRLLLAPGPHNVVVTRPGFTPWQRRITVEVGSEKSLNALLEREPPGIRQVTEAPQAALGQKPELDAVTGHNTSVSALAFSPDEKILASSSAGGIIKLWDVKSGIGLRTLTDEGSMAKESSEVLSLAFSPDGRILVSPIVKTVANPESEGKTTLVTEIAFWDVISGKKLNAILAPGKFISIAFSPDGRLIAGGNTNQTVTIWDLENGSEVRTFTGHPDEVSFVMFRPDGKGLLSGSFARGLKAWDLTNGTAAGDFAGNPLFLDPMNQPLKVAFNPATKNFASTVGSALMSDIVRILGGDKTTVQREFKSKEGGISSLTFNPSGRILAIGNYSGGVKLLNVDTGTELLTIKRGESNNVITMSPNGKIIAQSSEGENTIQLWDTNTETAMKILSGHTGDEISSLAFSPDSKLLASGSDDKTIRLWDVESESFKILKGHTDGIGSVIFSPDGKMLASIGDNLDLSDDPEDEDKTVRLWDVVSGRELKALTPSASVPTSIAFSPDGKVLAVGNENKAISLLDVASGTVLKTLSGNIGEVVSVMFITGEILQSVSVYDPDTIDDDQEAVADRNLWNLSSGLVIDSARFKESDTSSKDLMFMGNGLGSFAISQKFYAMPLQDGSLGLFNLPSNRQIDPSSKTELARIYLFGENDWLITTPEGFFDGSPRAWKHALWRFNNNTFDYGVIELYFKEFFYPNLLQEVIAGKSPKPPAGRDIEKTDRRQPNVGIADINGQSIAGINAPGAAQTPTDKRMATITIEVADNLEQPKQPTHAASSGVQDLRLFRNGSLVRVWHDDLFKAGAKDDCEQLAPTKAGEPHRVRCRAEVRVVAGENQFTAYAFNRENVKSEDSQLTIRGADALKRERTLYVLAIGVGEYENPQYKLGYAVKDAEDFSAEVCRQQEMIGYYQRVEVTTLLNQAAKKANVLDTLERFANVVQPEDGLIVYFSGHGRAQGDRFYLIPFDLGYKGSGEQVSFQTILANSISDLELEAAFRDIDAGRLLLVIDACNSGKALQADDWRRGPMNTKGLGQLAYEKGMYVLTASQDVELAYESDALQHSYLTYALVEEGLKAKVREADANGDEQVLLREWLDYGTRRVPLMRQEKVEQAARQQNKALEEVEVVEQGKVQQPRVFYRREPEVQPFIVAKVGVGK